MDNTGGVPAFIVGTGRCGSTLLSRAIALSDQVVSLSECFAVLGAERVLRDDVASTAQFLRTIAEIHSDQLDLLTYGGTIAELASHHSSVSDLHGMHPLLWITLQNVTATPRAFLHRL